MKKTISNIKFNHIINKCKKSLLKGNPDELYKWQNYILKNGNNQQLLTFAKEFYKYIDISSIQQHFIYDKDLQYCMLFAYEIPSADVNALLDCVLQNDKIGNHAISFMSIKNVDAEKIVNFFIENPDIKNKEKYLLYIANFNVSNESFEKIQNYIISTNNAYYCKDLACQSNRCDIKKLETIIYSSNDHNLLSEFYHNGKNINKSQCFYYLKKSILNCGNYTDIVDFVKQYKNKITQEEFQSFKEKIIESASYFSDGWDIADERAQYKEIVDLVNNDKIFEN